MTSRTKKFDIEWANSLVGGVLLIVTFFERVAEVRDNPKFFKILRNEFENYPIIIRMGMY
jgi:hypothetical protein